MAAAEPGSIEEICAKTWKPLYLFIYFKVQNRQEGGGHHTRDLRKGHVLLTERQSSSEQVHRLSQDGRAQSPAGRLAQEEARRNRGCD